MNLYSASTRQQVEDENDHCKNQQDVNEATADVEAEAKKPEDDEDDQYRPKHSEVFSVRFELQ